MEKPLLDAITVERFFCLAILPEGTDVASRVLKRFLDYRQRKDEVLAQLMRANKGGEDGERD